MPSISARADAQTRKALGDEPTVRAASDTFKILGDATRLKICLALAHRELCVGEIAAIVGHTDSAVSHQLRLLKTMRLVAYRKEGKMTYYMLDDGHINDLMRIAVLHVQEAAGLAHG